MAPDRFQLLDSPVWGTIGHPHPPATVVGGLSSAIIDMLQCPRMLAHAVCFPSSSKASRCFLCSRHPSLGLPATALCSWRLLPWALALVLFSLCTLFLAVMSTLRQCRRACLLESTPEP